MRVMLDRGAYMPERAHELDAGYDIRTPRRIVVAPYTALGGVGTAMIDTGVHVEIPAGHVGMLKSKSGLNTKCSIVGEGVIDAGYSGSIVVKLYNHSVEPYTFEIGDKIIQLVILPIITPELEKVDGLAETERGKITGTTDYMERFAAAEEKLKALGYEVINPAKVNAGLPDGTPYECYMDVSISMLKYADGIYMLSGWENSRGAKIELSWAARHGITLVKIGGSNA